MATALMGAGRAGAAPQDLSGAWTNNFLTQLERPDDFKALVASEAEAKAYEKAHLGKPPDAPPEDKDVGGFASEWWETDTGLARIRGQIRTSWLIAPADGQLPFRADVKKAQKARSARRKIDMSGPEARPRSERCLEAAVPPLLNGGFNDNFTIVQTPDHLAIYQEWMHDVRIVRLGAGQRHPAATLRWDLGDSIGHWEGATLVVETTNFTPSSIGPDAGPADDMTVIERFTRTSPGEVHYAFMVHAPAEYSQPWQGEMIFRPATGQIYEFACHEGNYALPGILSGGRQAEARARAAFARIAQQRAAGK